MITFKTGLTTIAHNVSFKGYTLYLPVGTEFYSGTNDDTYRFLTSRSLKVIAHEATGYYNSMLEHDLIHYGFNIESKYCGGY